MDFYKIRERSPKKDIREVYPEFLIRKSKDLMIRGKDFWAVWDERSGMWSQDAYIVAEIINDDLRAYREKMTTDDHVDVKWADTFSSQTWLNFVKYCKSLPDNWHQLDATLTFASTPVKKSDYVSRRLSYDITDGPCPAYEELISTLYDPDERDKIEWCIGAILSGESKEIQMFAALYGDPGSGKGTVMDIFQLLFQGYCTSFSAKEMTSGNNTFAMEALRSNPLVAIDRDAKLNRIEDNTKLNTVVSHEDMLFNEKFKSSYTMKLDCFLVLGTNDPIQITNAKSGLIRRLLDISPSGRTLPKRHYLSLKSQIQYELGQIAALCLQTYDRLGGKHGYDGYKPINMMYRTDPFFNFVEFKIFDFQASEGISLKNAYAMYTDYCEMSGTKRMEMYKFKEELKNYFEHFDLQTRIDGKQVRSWYSGFRADKFDIVQAKPKKQEKEFPDWLNFGKHESVLDQVLADYPAQYETDNPDHPLRYGWDKVPTKLRDLDTSKLHYSLGPPELVSLDFDLKNEKGEKDLDVNRRAIVTYGLKPTYAELSKGGQGIHLEYYYTGDISKVASCFAPGIEIKTFTGKFSLRRRLSLCNDIPIATLSSGLPVKEGKVVNFTSVQDEQHLRNLIEKALRKEIEPGATKTCVDFIEKILSDAYEQGLNYDVTDLRPRVTSFANGSSNQAAYCLTRVSKMKFCGKSYEAAIINNVRMDEHDILGIYGSEGYTDDRFVFFDVEVFPNLFLVNWKFAGDAVCQRMINPTGKEIESLFKLKLIGFNCRRYDNHILYARYIGKTLEELFDISQKIIAGSKNAMFGNAYDISYTDVYDFCAKKQSLKKWEIELGFHHQELGLPWDQPVPEDKWIQVAEYCDNDVFATEAVFNARGADWKARQILADLSGLSVNATTNSHTAAIIFNGNQKPQGAFNYRHMGLGQVDHTEYDDPFTAFDILGRPLFPGYRYESGKSLYRDEDVGRGGYVYAEQGVYRNVALLDIASMHPSSIVAENLFGDVYTKRFKDIMDIRILIKHKQYDKAGELFDGKLGKYLQDESQAKDLSAALKIAINSVYGLTSATFTNPFHDIRNVDNIVAKRGALFMVNLKHQVQQRGFKVAHIKTDSIKIPDATPEIIQFVMDYGKLYGYTFEHEATYDRMCLVNDAVYIAKYSNDERNEHPGQWTATGKQFQVPFVFKTLFSHEPITFDDLCETKTVTTALYLDMNENLPEDQHDYIFVGKAGQFCPVRSGCGGGLLMREKDGKYHAATGTIGYRWKESELIKALGLEHEIDRGYFEHLADEARKAVEEYCPFSRFVSDKPPMDDIPPWCMPCGESKYETCMDCPHWNPIAGECIDEAYRCDLEGTIHGK